MSEAGKEGSPRGELFEVIGGVERRLRLTNGEVEALERRLGNISSSTLMDVERLSRERAKLVVYAAMRGGGSDMDPAPAFKIIDEMRPAKLLQTALSCLVVYWTVDSPQEPTTNL